MDRNLWRRIIQDLTLIPMITKISITSLTPFNSLSDNNIRTILKDDSGKLWIGTQNKGLTALTQIQKILVILPIYQMT